MNRSVAHGRKSAFRRPALAVMAILLLLTTAVVFLAIVPLRPTSGVAEVPASLGRVLVMSGAELARCDIARLNLLCAEGLPGAESVSPEPLLALLDSWAARIRTETERHLYRYRANPAEYENSESFFRLLMMTVVVQEDFKVRYNPARANAAEGGGLNDGFFKDSRDVFLHGLLTGERVGTCSSIPVLYAALGRRLGYPLRLVTTKGHLFLRWESVTERFNAEVTSHGLSRFDDAYYKQWPFEITDSEVQAEGYLKSLSAAEELAVFLSIRGLCLMEAGRSREAAEAFAQATRRAPEVESCRYTNGVFFG